MTEKLENYGEQFSGYEKWIFLGLTPLFLLLVYYKIVTGPDTAGLLFISIIVFAIYLPMHIIVKEKDLEASFDAVFLDERVLRHTRLVSYLVVVFCFSFLMASMQIEALMLVGIVAMLILLVIIARNILNLYKQGSFTSKVKLFSAFLFILVLTLMTFKDEILFFLFFPAVGMFIFWLEYGSKKTFKLSFKKWTEYRIYLAIVLIYGLFLLFAGIVNAFNSTINALDPYVYSVIITLAMVVVSAAGSYLQLNIFASYFISDADKKTKAVLGCAAAFYLILAINMGIVGTIEKNAKSVHATQKGAKSFSDMLLKYVPE